MHLCVNVSGRKNKSMIGGRSLHSTTLVGNGYQVRVHSCLSHSLDLNYLRPLHIYINNALEKLQTQEQVRTNNTAFPSVTRQLVYNGHTDLGSGCEGDRHTRLQGPSHSPLDARWVGKVLRHMCDAEYGKPCLL